MKMSMYFLLFALTASVSGKICFRDNELVTSAVSYLEPNRQPAAGYEKFKVTGKVYMTQRRFGGPTFIRLEVQGLQPYTTHGFHIHVYGDIFSRGCQSAGSHYNPYNKIHGGPRDTNRHVGDLGNIWADARGKVSTSFFDQGLISLGGPHSVIGRSFVLHAKRDDLGRGKGRARAESLKTGNAGARLSCGVIVHAPVIRRV